MFEVDEVYRNRIGEYTVLEVDGPKMRVRYSDGNESELIVAIQERIWLNMIAEKEAQAGRKSKKKSKKKNTKHYIKVVSIPPGEGLIFPGWQEGVVMALTKDQSERLNSGDRFIYFALESQVFFAVVTITADAFKAKPKQYTYTIELDDAYFFHTDVDTTASSLETAVSVESVELESYPDFKKLKVETEGFYRISEDDFELLSEALTEMSEIASEEDKAAEGYIEEEEV